MILIVDEKSENLFSLKRVLEESHFEVDVAYSGAEALRKLASQEYTLIILEVEMSGMDGYQVAEALLSGARQTRDIPIMFLLEANTEKQFVRRGFSSGGADYVTKPVDPDILLLKVQTLHRLYEQHWELRNIRASLMLEIEVRREAERNLTRLNAEQQALIRSFPQIVFTVSPDCTIEFVNDYWYDYSSTLSVFPELHPDDVTKKDELNCSVKDGLPFIRELRIRHLSTGIFRYHLLRMVPLMQDGQLIKWIGTFTDIHEQKTARDELEVMVAERTKELTLKNTELEWSNHELQQFASVASHDLQEPLRKIQMYSNRIYDRFRPQAGEALTYVKRIVDASGRMSSLITDLLSYSRLSIKSLFRKTDLNELIKGIITDLEFSIREKKAELIVEPLPEIECVEGQIRQVFQNLISNALKFSREGYVPRVRICSELYREESGREMCHICIRDNGIGFDEQYLDKIFTIFQRLNAKEAYEGTGIGLAIVKKIVEKHSGSITAHSSEGHGATFILSLPLYQSEETLI